MDVNVPQMNFKTSLRWRQQIVIPPVHFEPPQNITAPYSIMDVNVPFSWWLTVRCKWGFFGDTNVGSFGDNIFKLVLIVKFSGAFDGKYFCA